MFFFNSRKRVVPVVVSDAHDARLYGVVVVVMETHHGLAQGTAVVTSEKTKKILSPENVSLLKITLFKRPWHFVILLMH